MVIFESKIYEIFFMFLAFTYTYLTFKFVTTIMEMPRFKTPFAHVLVALFNVPLFTALVLISLWSSFAIYLLIWFILFVEFSVFYNDSIFSCLFSSSYCILHIMSIRAICVAITALLNDTSLYIVSNDPSLLLFSTCISLLFINFTIISILKFLPAKGVKIINQHHIQLGFLLTWMTVFNLYLLCNAQVYDVPQNHPSLIWNQLFAPIAILVGLYIVLFFSIKTSLLLGYKAKSEELQRDINEEKLYHLKLKNYAEHDALTGLYNRGAIKTLISELLSAPSVTSGALFVIDIDNFKYINDHFGHIHGDAVLCEISKKLSDIFNDDGVVGRIGGDEFIAFLSNPKSLHSIKLRGEVICNAFLEGNDSFKDTSYTISGSVGISLFPQDGKTFEMLYENSDVALYSVKNLGKNSYKIYDGSAFIGYETART